MIRYQHTQRGTVVRVALLIGAALCFVLGQFLAAPPFVVPVVLIVCVICAYIFSSLSIQITDRALHWSFGPGFFRKELALTEIKTVAVTRTRLVEGWGIHKTSRGWLYNVSGFDAVLITLRSGRSILLGTDDPQALHKALTRALG